MRMEINLLPHRQARRVADLRETLAVLVLGLVVVIGGSSSSTRAQRASSRPQR